MTKDLPLASGPTLFPRQRDFVSTISNHTYALAYGSSRASKTYGIATVIVIRALKYAKSDHLILRLTGNSIKTTVWKTFQLVIEEFGLRDRVTLNSTDLTITFENGSMLVFGGVQDEDRIAKILGAEYATIFINEGTEINFATFELVNSRLNGNWFDAAGKRCPLKFIADCNPTTKRHWLYQQFIEKVVPGTKIGLNDPDDYGSLHFDAKANPSVDENYYRRLRNSSAAAQRRFIEGQWTDEVQGALFSSDDLDNNRRDAPDVNDFDLIVVGVDPAVTCTPESDETGIIVAGMIDDAEGRHYYPLADLSGRYHPHQWAEMVANAYDDFGAGLIVVETTQGGDQNAHTLRTADPRLTIVGVNPGRGQGKNVRALPIASEMRAGRIHFPHDTRFKELEAQLLLMTGDFDRRRNKSPDRLDSFVYAISEMLTGDGPAKPVVVSRVANYFR